MNYRFNNPRMLKDNRIRIQMRKDFFEIMHESYLHIQELTQDEREEMLIRCYEQDEVTLQ